MNNLKEKFEHYYEIDLDNCHMTDDDWIKELAKALSDPITYMEDFNKEYNQYLEMINA